MSFHQDTWHYDTSEYGEEIEQLVHREVDDLIQKIMLKFGKTEKNARQWIDSDFGIGCEKLR